MKEAQVGFLERRGKKKVFIELFITQYKLPKFEIKKLGKWRPGVKQIDGSVVCWKPAHIALRTAGLDNLPKSSRKLQL